MVDLFEDDASMSSASMNIVRCLLGAVGTSTIQPMLNAMGTGWAFTTLAFIGLVTMPILRFQLCFGYKYRAQRDESKAQPNLMNQSNEIDSEGKVVNTSPRESVHITTDNVSGDCAQVSENVFDRKEDGGVNDLISRVGA